MKNTKDDKTTGKQGMDVDEIQEIIRSRICLHLYKPGTTLKESVIAKEFGVSRTPLREALNRLKHLGLIESRNGVGTVVVEMTSESLMQIYRLRLELASMIGTLDPKPITEDHLHDAEALLSMAQSLCKDFNGYDYLDINHKLNYLITDIIGNFALKNVWIQLHCQAASVWFQIAQDEGVVVAEALVDELSDLISALQQHDEEAVGYVQRVHINYGFKRIKRYIARKNSHFRTDSLHIKKSEIALINSREKDY